MSELIWLGNGTLRREYNTRLEYQRVMAASPYPFILTWPQSSTVATPSLLELNFTQPVTSAVVPSEYFARTTSCCSASGARAAAAGKTSRPRIWASPAAGGGAPAAIHSSITRYSSESLANRLPPPCGIANDGFKRIRLAAGSVSDTRRPTDCRVSVS